MGLDEGQFVATELISANLRCPICTDIFDDPVFASGQPCHCTFCRACIMNWLAANTTCPNDRKPLDAAQLVADMKIRNFVLELPVCCRLRVDGCYWTGRLDARAGHEAECPVIMIKKLADQLSEKDSLIAALTEQLDMSERANGQLRRELDGYHELQAWVATFFAAAPPSLQGLLQAAVNCGGGGSSACGGGPAASSTDPSGDGSGGYAEHRWSTAAWPEIPRHPRHTQKGKSSVDQEADACRVGSGDDADQPPGRVEMLVPWRCPTLRRRKKLACTDESQEESIAAISPASDDGALPGSAGSLGR